MDRDFGWVLDPSRRNLLILFPEDRRGMPSTYLAPRLVTGVSMRSAFVRVASMPNSLVFCAPRSPARGTSSSQSKLSRTAPCHYRYAPALPVLRQLPGPLIISDEMTPERLRNDNVEGKADSPLKSYY